MPRASETATEFPTHRLANGLTIVGQPMAGVQSAALGLMLTTGAKDETAAVSGVAHFVESIAFQGTQHRDSRQLTEAFEAIGARYGASAGSEVTWYSAQVLGRHVIPALELLVDVVRWPGFPAAEVPKVRSRLVQEIAQIEDQPMALVGELLARTYFGAHPLGQTVHGRRESIAAIDPAALADFWTTQYRPNRAYLTVAGNIQFDEVVGAAERLLGDWTAGDAETALAAVRPRRARASLKRDTNQQHIMLASPAITVRDPAYYTLLIAIDILGGGMNSRLFEEVREQRGLAYGVSAGVSVLKRHGFVQIYCGTTPDKADQSVQVILEQLRLLADKGVTENEVRLAQTSLKSSVIMRNESTTARRTVLGTQLWMRGAVRTLAETRRAIEAVTVEKVNALVQRLAMADRLTLVTIGPRSAEELMPDGV